MPCVILERAGRIDDRPHLRFVVVRILEVRLLLERGVDRDVQLTRHEVGEPLPLPRSQAVHAGDVLDRLLRLETPERDDLRDVAVLGADVIDHGAAAVLADVDVDVGVLGAVGVGEPLEQQTVLHRTRVRETEHETDHRAHARSTGARGDVRLARPVHDVPADQEVCADELVGEDLELAIEPGALHIVDTVRPVPPDRARLGEHAQRAVALRLELVLGGGVHGGVVRLEAELPAEGRVPLGRALRMRAVEPVDDRPRLGGIRRQRVVGADDLDDGRVVRVEVEVDVAAVGDTHRVLDRLGHVGKQLGHRLRRLHVQLDRITKPARLALHLLHRDTAEAVMRVVILGPQEVSVVVAHEREIELTGEADQVGVDALLLLHAVTLELDVEPRLATLVDPERVSMPARLLDRGAVVILVARLHELNQVMGDRAAEVPVDRDEPLRPLAERLLVHPRLVVEAVEERVGRQPHQVAPSRLVLGEQDEVKSAVGDPRLLALRTITDGDVRLDAQDRLDALRPGFRVELDDAVEVPVIGDGHRRHPQLRHAIDEPADLVAAVEERVFGVEVKVTEAEVAARHNILGAAGALRHDSYHRLGIVNDLSYGPFVTLATSRQLTHDGSRNTRRTSRKAGWSPPDA